MKTPPNSSVMNRQHGSIDTWGESAVGLFAQSVGGGGGNGGFSIALSGAGTGPHSVA